MNRKERMRAAVLAVVEQGEMTIVEAAEAMGLSQGQVRRLLVKYREGGPEALAHGNRGRKPVGILDPSIDTGQMA